MKILKCLLIVALCLCLCGCNILSGGSHIYVEEHQPISTSGISQNVTAKNYRELYRVLVHMVENGVVQQVISVEKYDDEVLESDLQTVFQDLCASHPIAAYAVERIDHTVGTVNGADAVSVEITYLHGASEIRKIVTVDNNDGARETIAQALTACETGVVLLIRDFQETDFTQMVEDYARDYPEFVMEQPQVTVSTFPENPDAGVSRVVELKFTYHTNRESLKNMQNQVSPVFRSAALYVSGDAAQEEKLSQLYSFLMERYEYTIESSITPAYSLLRHGVGDSRAFATVYAAMCRQAELTCLVVTGTLAGENCFWNMVCMDGVYYHLDLLASNADGAYTILSDAEMRERGYLWDFDAYPVCDHSVNTEEPEIQDPTAPPEVTEKEN